MLKFRLIMSLQVLMVGAFLLSACGGIPAELQATLTAAPDQIRTQAVGTFAMDLTATALLAPTNTPASTNTPLATMTPLTPLATSAVGGAVGTTAPVTGGGTTSCYQLTYVSDVTIPDNTSVTAGQKFTKTWKVQNTGTCAWDAGFKFSHVSGDAMGGQTYTLPSAVGAGAVTEISIAMTAPNKTGTVRGDWQMSTANGQAFPGAIYVQVVVGGGAAATNTTGAPAATGTSTPTGTATTNSQ